MGLKVVVMMGGGLFFSMVNWLLVGGSGWVLMKKFELCDVVLVFF